MLRTLLQNFQLHVGAPIEYEVSEVPYTIYNNSETFTHFIKTNKHLLESSHI